MKNKFLKIGAIVLLSFFIFSRQAEAHFLLVDNNIGAVFHTDPDDNPPAGALTTFTFDFKDTANQLNLSACDCTFSIINNGSPIYSGKLGVDPNVELSGNTINFVFTLPTTGIYTIVAEGKSASSSLNFQSFKLSYDLEVNTVSNNTSTSSSEAYKLIFHSLHYGLFGAAILIALYIVVRDKRRGR